LAALLPFIDKPAHIDDPVYIWCAQHIQKHPLDFYGFEINWEGQQASVASLNQNPPLVSYYMALVGSVLGWSEISLHLGLLVPALAVVIGTFFLAGHFCAQPMIPALITATAPVFVLCSSTLMSDISMLACWVWAAHFWFEGWGSNHKLKLVFAAVLISASALTKYFGAALIPLLLVYSLVERRKLSATLAVLLIPVIVLACYQWLTRHLYGHGLLSNAASYATTLRVGGALPWKCLTAVAFAGGCVLIILPLIPSIWGRKGVLCGLGGSVLLGVFLYMAKKAGSFPLVHNGQVNWAVLLQLAVFSMVGFSILVLVVFDLSSRRDAGSTFLALWIAGTFLFAAAVNWTVSGRTILPILPAVGLLVARRLEHRRPTGPESSGPIRPALYVPALLFSFVIALMVTQADYNLALSARNAAFILKNQIGAGANTIWFEGHWGFQYYMQKLGGKALDRQHLMLQPKDAVLAPMQNSYLFPLPEDSTVPWFQYACTPSRWLVTMNAACGAGFYADSWGPLPFAAGKAPAEEYWAFHVK